MNRQPWSISEWREIRSLTRPTVPTTTWPPARSCACWVRIGAPPNTATTSTPLRAAVRAQRLRDLDAQLARRGQHEPLDLVLARIDVAEHRQPERRGLAGPGLGLADHVVALQQRRDRLLLDRARRLVADVVRGLEDVGSGSPSSAKVVMSH